MREPVLPDDTICASCHCTRLERVDESQDSIAWWLSYRCPDCGATGKVENLRAGGSRYHGDVTTPRRADLDLASWRER